MKKRTRIKVLDYPLDLDFYTTIKLPAFKYGCPVRTKLVQRKLRGLNYESFHGPEDFIVEQIQVFKDGEIWHLGS